MLYSSFPVIIFLSAIFLETPIDMEAVGRGTASFETADGGQTDLYTAYQRGRLTTKYELRRTVIKLAKAGSPAAEPLADKYLTEQIVKE